MNKQADYAVEHIVQAALWYVLRQKIKWYLYSCIGNEQQYPGIPVKEKVALIIGHSMWQIAIKNNRIQ